MTTITLIQIHSRSPCADGWQKLLDHLDKTDPDDEPLPMTLILDSNGLDDCLWALRCLSPEHESWMRKFARECASDVLHLWDAPQVVRDYLATGEESQRAAAEAAAEAAAWTAARDAAEAAAWAAARDAARAAARNKQAIRLRGYLKNGGKP